MPECCSLAEVIDTFVIHVIFYLPLHCKINLCFAFTRHNKDVYILHTYCICHVGHLKAAKNLMLTHKLKYNHKIEMIKEKNKRKKHMDHFTMMKDQSIFLK